jgi:hypothetical protein
LFRRFDPRPNAFPVSTNHGDSGHSADWWAQFASATDRIDPASVAEVLGDVIAPRIPSPLLRREAQIAVHTVVRHLNKPAVAGLAERGGQAAARLAATVARLEERATDDGAGIAAAAALVHVLHGRWAEGAAAAEPLIGTVPLVRALIPALCLENVDAALTLRLLGTGQAPSTALQSSLAIARYGWWPTWLLKVVTERALAGTLDADVIAALDRCAYAELSPAQARLARRLFDADTQLVDAVAYRLETLGEPSAAGRLREGDLSAVALAARLIPL